jgi:hypothetical protein
LISSISFIAFMSLISFTSIMSFIHFISCVLLNSFHSFPIVLFTSFRFMSFLSFRFVSFHVISFGWIPFHVISCHVYIQLLIQCLTLPWIFCSAYFIWLFWHLNDHLLIHWCTSQSQSLIASASHKHSYRPMTFYSHSFLLNFRSARRYLVSQVGDGNNNDCLKQTSKKLCWEIQAAFKCAM